MFSMRAMNYALWTNWDTTTKTKIWKFFFRMILADIERLLSFSCYYIVIGCWWIDWRLRNRCKGLVIIMLLYIILKFFSLTIVHIVNGLIFELLSKATSSRGGSIRMFINFRNRVLWFSIIIFFFPLK